MRRNFPDFLKAYLEYTSGHEATPRCHLWSAISVIAAAMERKVWMDRGFYTLYPNLYVFIVGRSGLIKKSTTTAVAVNMLRDLDGVRIMSDRLTAGSLVAQMERCQKAFEYKGMKVKQSPIFAYASELKVFLNEVFGNLSELLTTFYDCVHHDPNKPWVYETVGTGEKQIFGSCLNILAATTKAWLKQCIPVSEMEGGFSSRILFVVENNPPAKLVPWPQVSKDNARGRMLLVEDLNTIYNLVGPMQVTPEATKMFSDWYEHHMKVEVIKDTDTKWSGYMGRKGDIMLKLAMVRSVSLRNTLELTESDLVWAGRHLEAIEKDMREAFEGVGQFYGSELTNEIYLFIKKKRRVAKPEILKAFSHMGGNFEITRSLNDLLERCDIAAHTEAFNDRPLTYYTPSKIYIRS